MNSTITRILVSAFALVAATALAQPTNPPPK